MAPVDSPQTPQRQKIGWDEVLKGVHLRNPRRREGQLMNSPTVSTERLRILVACARSQRPLRCQRNETGKRFATPKQEEP